MQLWVHEETGGPRVPCRIAFVTQTLSLTAHKDTSERGPSLVQQTNSVIDATEWHKWGSRTWS